MNFLLNPWVLACYGWLLYQLFTLMKNRKEFDKDNSGFLSIAEIHYYFMVELLPMIFSIWLIPVGVLFAPDIWAWIMDLAGKDWEFTKAVYVLMGSLSAIVQWMIKKIT